MLQTLCLLNVVAKFGCIEPSPYNRLNFIMICTFYLHNSLLGMHLFGGRFCRRADGYGMCTCEELRKRDAYCLCDRMNFDNFLWATVTVFQVRITKRKKKCVLLMV